MTAAGRLRLHIVWNISDVTMHDHAESAHELVADAYKDYLKMQGQLHSRPGDDNNRATQSFRW
jgi:hypothetical protein